MKKRTTLLMSTMVTLAALSTTASADNVLKGQNAYLKNCKECHGNGTKGSAMNTQAGWEKLFDNDGAEIIKKHKGKDGEDLFNSAKFQKLAPYLKEFLYKYGSDSGNVPSCG